MAKSRRIRIYTVEDSCSIKKEDLEPRDFVIYFWTLRQAYHAYETLELILKGRKVETLQLFKVLARQALAWAR